MRLFDSTDFFLVYYDKTVILQVSTLKNLYFKSSTKVLKIQKNIFSKVARLIFMAKIYFV